MEKILRGKGKWGVIALFVLLAAASGILLFFVKINYDLTEYLPADSETAAGVAILEEEFGEVSAIQVMVNDCYPAEGTAIVERMEAVPGVSSVTWLGTAVDPTTPIEFIDTDLLERFYQDGSLMFWVTIEGGAYDREAETIVKNLRETLSGTDSAIRGEVLENIEARKIASSEIFKVLLIVVPLCVVVLLIIGKSWFEPVLILGNLAVAVLLNMGTNALLPHVSYITMTMTMALQLALSLDYSLFLLHRFEEERERGLDLLPAIGLAAKKTFVSVSGSALTTIAGFLALCLMRYTIGTDLGIVLSKGILCSYLSAILLMPILLFFSAGILEKSRHRPLFVPRNPRSPKRFRFRYVWTGLFAVLAIVGFFMQKQNDYLYGNSSAQDPDSVLTLDKAAIQAKFGAYNPVVVLASDIGEAQETAFIASLKDSSYVLSVDALTQAVDPSIPREFIPETVKEAYLGSSYTRIIVYLREETESADLYEAVDFLKEKAEAAFDTYHLVGFAPATADIRTPVLGDSSLVLWVTFLAILGVIFLLFRSLTLPFLLTLLIQGAVWINFAIGFLQGRPILFIGFLIVSALQMGGTVDYGILLSGRYLDLRKTQNPETAMRNAMAKSTPSILTSSLILAFAGFTEGIVSAIPSVSAIGYLIGRGALLAALVILLFQPSVLLTFDRWIQKTTYYPKRSEEK